MTLATIKTVLIHHLKNVKNNDKEDTWIPSSKIILIVMLAAVKNTSIMAHLFIKILRESLQKKINSFYRIYREREATLFMTLGKRQTQNKKKISFSTSLTQIISCKILSLIHNLRWKKLNRHPVSLTSRKKSYKTFWKKDKRFSKVLKWSRSFSLNLHQKLTFMFVVLLPKKWSF